MRYGDGHGWSKDDWARYGDFSKWSREWSKWKADAKASTTA